MSNPITNYNVNVNGVKQDLGTIIRNTNTRTIDIPTSGVTNITNSINVNSANQQVIYDNCIYPSMSGSSVNGNTAISFGANKRYGDNGMWVAVGAGTNTIAYSSDGINWTGLGNSIFTTGNGVAWNGNLWVAVGMGSNSIAYSYDGISWVGLGNAIFGVGGFGNGIIWDGQKWIAVGAGSSLAIIANSQDGINWSKVSTNPFTGSGTSAFCNGIAYNGKMYVIVGSGGGSATAGTGINSSIAYSYDGSNNWFGVIDSRNILFPGRSIVWNGTKWIAGGNSGPGNQVCNSFDGINWFVLPTISNFTLVYCLGWNGKLCVAGGTGSVSNTLAYSPDGSNNWTGLGYNTFSTSCRDIKWNGTKWVAVGGSTNTIAYSSDGINWIGLGVLMFNEGKGIAWGGSNLPNTITFPRNLTIAGGSGTNSIACSPDGSNNWVGVSNSLNQCNGIAWNGTMWVAVGIGKSGKGPIAYSYDGSNNWLDTSSNVFTTGNGIGWNGKMWVAVGSGTNSIAYSYDGITWSGVSGSSTILSIGRNVAWNNKKWIAVGKGGTHSIANSFDGINWFGVISTFLSNTNGANAIAWNGTIWVAGGFPTGGQSIAYSFDGSNNWTAATATSICTTSCKSVAWNGYKWVAGGQGGSSVATSSDGINWTSAYSTFSDCSGVTWNGTKWIAVGSLPSSKKIAYSSDGSNNWASIANSNTIFSSGGNAVAYNQNIPSVKIQHPTIAVGSGTNTIAYSPDGIKWTGLGKTIFSTTGRGVAWNGKLWVAVGSGTNTIAYSQDGINWTGLGNSIFSTSGNGISWNGTIWVAVGQGTNSIAYSSDGINWTGLGKTTFSYSGICVAWNGTRWVAVGTGTSYSIAYSSDGINWTNGSNVGGAGSDTIFAEGFGVAWNGTLWVAVGYGTHEIVYSSDGITWTGVPGSKTNIFSYYGNDVAWNGKLWIAVGEGTTHTIAYSYDGINWLGLGKSIFSVLGYGVAWNGTRWVALGEGTYSIAYSSDGITWTGVTNSNNIFTEGYGVAGNPKVGATIVPSAIHLNNNINSNTLTFSSESYYQNGVNNITIGVTSKPT